MNKIIFDAATKYPSRHLVDIPHTTGSALYFFFRQELENADSIVEYQQRKKTTLRHLTIHNNKFYDYIAKKHYDTLADWAIENKKSLNDILYGINPAYHDATDSYISLDDLLLSLNENWVWPEEHPANQEYTKHSQIVEEVNATLAKMKQEIDDIRNILSQMM